MTQGQNAARARVFPWYDSDWLGTYVAACDVVLRVAPARLREFISAFDPLRTSPGFAPSKRANVLSSQRLADLRAMVRGLSFSELELHEAQAFGRVIVHDHPLLGTVQQELLPLVEELAGEAVEPNYNFLSLYSTMGRCAVHMDAPEAKWTLDLCIDQSGPWPIHFSQIVPWPVDRQLARQPDWDSLIRNDPALRFTPHVHEPGEAVFFSGSSQWHYRNAIEPQGAGEPFCNLVFFHYIPEGTRALVEPGQWAAHFGIPELGEVIPSPAALPASRLGRTAE